METGSRQMIVFDQDHARFNFRAAAVIIQNDCVLLHRADCDSFWSLPGGRVELLEDSPTAIVREMHEELRIETSVDRLLWVAENFFVHAGVSYHEICLYFLLRVHSAPTVFTHAETFIGDEEGQPYRLTFHWFPRSLPALQSVTILPAFLVQGLVNIPTTTILITNID